MAERSITITAEKVGPCLQTPRWWAADFQLMNGNVFFAGGQYFEPAKPNQPAQEVPLDSFEIVDPEHCSSSVLRNRMSFPRRGTNFGLQIDPTSALLLGGNSEKLLIELLNLQTGAVQSVGSLTEVRLGQSNIVLLEGPDRGKVLIAGGYGSLIPPQSGGDGKKRNVLNSAELFDPKTGKTDLLPPMTMPRASHSITPLGEGRYLIVGGLGESANRAEVYDSKWREFSPVDQPLHFGRKDHRAFRTKDGKIYFVGGTDATGHSVAGIEYFQFDPKTGKPSFVKVDAPLGGAREDLAALYIPTLDIIVAVGGEEKGATREGKKDPHSDVVDVFDLTRQTVTSAKLAFGPRDEPTLHLLSVDAVQKIATLILLTGLGEDENHQLLPLPAERVVIKAQ